MVPKMAFALDSLDLHISRNLVNTLCWLILKILTVKGSFFRALDRASDNAKTTGSHLVN